LLEFIGKRLKHIIAATGLTGAARVAGWAALNADQNMFFGLGHDGVPVGQWGYVCHSKGDASHKLLFLQQAIHGLSETPQSDAQKNGAPKGSVFSEFSCATRTRVN
jgi:hypothetical protein